MIARRKIKDAKTRGFISLLIPRYLSSPVRLSHLMQKLITRTSNNGQTFLSVRLMQLLKSLVLRCKSALGGGVDDQDDFAAEVRL